MTCGRIPSWRDRNTASHVGVSNFKIKPPDNQAVPQCGKCHWLFEYHKDKFREMTRREMPTLQDCAYFFELWCTQAGRSEENV